MLNEFFSDHYVALMLLLGGAAQPLLWWCMHRSYQATAARWPHAKVIWGLCFFGYDAGLCGLVLQGIGVALFGTHKSGFTWVGLATQLGFTWVGLATQFAAVTFLVAFALLRRREIRHYSPE